MKNRRFRIQVLRYCIAKFYLTRHLQHTNIRIYAQTDENKPIAYFTNGSSYRSSNKHEDIVTTNSRRTSKENFTLFERKSRESYILLKALHKTLATLNGRQSIGRADLYL